VGPRFREAMFFAPALGVLLLPLLVLRSFTDRHSVENPLNVARSYVGAIHARDYREAYSFLSSGDKLAMDQHGHPHGELAPVGFAMQLAKQLSAGLEIRVIEQEIKSDWARFTLNYKLPATDEISLLLFNWDQDKLNALSRSERQRVRNALGKLKKAPNAITMESRETFDLIKENGHWKIFFNWAAQTPVTFAAALPANSGVEVEVLQRRLFAGTDEPFQTSLKIRNRGERETIARIEHRIEPKAYAGRLAMIACGFLRPLTLDPGEEREVSSAYLLDSDFPKNTPLQITFNFDLANAPSADTSQKFRRGF
jgi:hypothetical protein